MSCGPSRLGHTALGSPPVASAGKKRHPAIGKPALGVAFQRRGTSSLEAALGCGAVAETQQRPAARWLRLDTLRHPGGEKMLPLTDASHTALGKRSAIIQSLVAQGANSPLWPRIRRRWVRGNPARHAKFTPPNRKQRMGEPLIHQTTRAAPVATSDS